MSTPLPLKDPYHYASGYDLHLYCDHMSSDHGFDEFPHRFSAETFRQCAKLAVKRGWIIHENTRTATCPKCAKKQK